MKDKYELSRPAFEAKYPVTGTSITEQTMLRILWEAWCAALDYAESQQKREISEHVCAFHMDMMGTCFVCGSTNESIREFREKEEKNS